MAVPVFQSVTTDSVTVGVLPVPSGAVSGDIMVIVYYVSPDTATITLPAGFVAAPNSPVNQRSTATISTNLHIGWKRLTGPDTGSYTVATTGATFQSGQCLRLTDAAASGTPFDAPAGTSSSNATSTTTTAVSTTTLGGDRLLLWAGHSYYSASWTPPSGFVELSDFAANGVASKAQAVAGASGSVSGTNSNTAANSYLAAWLGGLIGATATTQSLTPAGIGSSEVFGAASVSPGPIGITAAGLPSAHAFGAAVVSPGAVTLTAAGIVSGEVFGAAVLDAGLRPAGVVSAEVFGAAVLTPGPVTLTAAGIASGQVFGAAVVLGGIVAATGVVSAEVFGGAVVAPGPVGLTAAGIPGGEVFGAAAVTPIVTEIASELLIRPAPTVTYELVCVARVPQPAGPPVLIEVDPIDWTGLSWAETLSRKPTLTAGCAMSGLTDPVLQRLETLEQLATEVWLYRNGKLVFAGPMFGAQVQGETLTLQAAGLLGYLELMVVTQDLMWVGVDQHAIATGLIDHWQQLEYGHFGIDTTGIAPSGVTRDATYLRNEEHYIGQRVAELGGRENGFDVAVDPASRKLELSYPQRGVDRSSGEDAIVFDARNVTSPNLICSVAPGDVASEVIGIGTGTGTTLYSVRSNPALRAQYGRSAVAASFDGVSEQGTLDAHTQGLLDARGRALFIPGPDLRVTPDAEVAAYDVGDTVSYQLHARLSVAGPFRIRRRTVVVSKTGQEAVSLEFV